MHQVCQALDRRKDRVQHWVEMHSNTEEVFAGTGLADGGSRSFFREEMESRDGLLSEANQSSPVLFRRLRRDFSDEINEWEKQG